MTLTLTQIIPTSPKTLYYMLTNEDALAYWLCDRAYTRVEQNGHILLYWLNNSWYMMGEFIQLQPDEAVAHTWRVKGEDKTTTVSYHLQAVDDGTKLTLTHDGLADDELSAYEMEWRIVLRNLSSALTTGADIRILERILIGIFPDTFDEKVAERLGVPVKEGLLVGNTMPGLGAEKAGLKSGDVIIEANGKPVRNNVPLTANFAGLKPGDTVDVIFYRGAEQHTVQLTLSGYPLPPAVSHFNQLADRMQADYATLYAELSQILTGLSDETANTPPMPGEWSANQILAHLILTERNYQEFLGGYVQAPELHAFTANASARVNAVVQSYGNTQALLNELKRAYAETVAIIRAFEDEKFERPYILWWANFQLGNITGGHNREHILQIQDTLAKLTQ